jgi:hypothetical protein
VKMQSQISDKVERVELSTLFDPREFQNALGQVAPPSEHGASGITRPTHAGTAACADTEELALPSRCCGVGGMAVGGMHRGGRAALLERHRVYDPIQ